MGGFLSSQVKCVCVCIKYNSDGGQDKAAALHYNMKWKYHAGLKRFLRKFLGDQG